MSEESKSFYKVLSDHCLILANYLDFVSKAKSEDTVEEITFLKDQLVLMIYRCDHYLRIRETMEYLNNGIKDVRSNQLRKGDG